MKTKKQIECFLRGKKYKSPMDFEGISSYCKVKFGIKLHRPSSYTSEDALDFTTFGNWIVNGFGGGDVVEWGENIGLVQDGGVKEVKICLKIDRNGVNFNPFMLDVQLIHLAGENALNRISEALEENNMDFGISSFCISERTPPESGDIISFTNKKTGDKGAGIVRQFYKDSGKIVMYCYYTKEQGVKYSMEETLGVISDFSYRIVAPVDYPRKALDVELAKVGKTWNHNQKRIEPIKMRVPKGSPYWYISDKMMVVRDTEKETITSNKRYSVGNYFRREEDAIRILAAENELRRKFLAEPEKG